MTDFEKDRRFHAVVMQIVYGLAFAFVAAVASSSFSFYANNGTSLFADILWAMVGGVIGLLTGIVFYRKVYLR